jgi:hypothetical protein
MWYKTQKTGEALSLCSSATRSADQAAAVTYFQLRDRSAPGGKVCKVCIFSEQSLFATE